jgi:hypothetical protein
MIANNHRIMTKFRSKTGYRLDKALYGGIGRQILLYIAVVLLLFLLLWGLAALINIPIRSEKTTGFSDFWTMLFFFYDGGLEGTLPNNRWFVYLVNLLGSIVMGGILIATITNFLQSHTTKAEEGLLRYRLTDHTVFIGYHDAMFPVIRSVIKNGSKAIVLSERPANEIRDLITSGLEGMNTDNVIVYHGLRTSPEELESLCIDKASSIVLFPSQDFADSDSINLDVIDSIARICERNGRSGLDCTACFKQEISGTGFERADVNERIKKTLRFNPIIYCDSIARALLSGKVYSNPILDREPITEESCKRVHLFVIGIGEMGKALFCQAVRQLHFPNYEKTKCRITLVGSPHEIRKLKDRYREFFAISDYNEKYAYLGDILDLSIQVLQMQDLDSSLDTAVDDNDSLVSVAVCHENTASALERALSLPRSVYEKHIPILLYKPDSDSIAKLIGENSFYSNIIPFGAPGEITMNDDSLLTAMRINWVYSFFSQNGKVPESLPGEQEWNQVWLPAWNGLSVKNKWSNIHHADSIPVKLRSMAIKSQLTERQLEILSRVEHNRWVAETLLAGFRPPIREEREEMMKDIQLKSVYKDKMVHLDLCKFDDLLPDATGIDVRSYDRAIEQCIPLFM